MKVKIVQLNKRKGLLRGDYIDVLKTWLDLYVYIDIPGSSNKSIKTGLLKVAASLYVIDELKKSPAAYRIKKASALALKGGNLEEIKILIAEAALILAD